MTLREFDCIRFRCGIGQGREEQGRGNEERKRHL